MKKIRLTETELINLIKRVIKEDEMMPPAENKVKACKTSLGKVKSNYSLSNLKPLVVVEITGDASMVTMKMGTDTMKEKIKVGSVIPVKREIIMNEGTEILFKDIQDFGQPVLNCKEGVATAFVTTE
jgi:hypothetical protein